MNGPTSFQMDRVPDDPMAFQVVASLNVLAYGGEVWANFGPDGWTEPGCPFCGCCGWFWPHEPNCPVTRATDALIAVDMH